MFPVLFTFYIQDVLKLKNNSCAKSLNIMSLCPYSYFSDSAHKAHLFCQHNTAVVACLALPYFSHIDSKRHDFREKKMFRTYNVYFYFIYKFGLKHFAF